MQSPCFVFLPSQTPGESRIANVIAGKGRIIPRAPGFDNPLHLASAQLAYSIFPGDQAHTDPLTDFSIMESEDTENTQLNPV